jgi:hypothetical protein
MAALHETVEDRPRHGTEPGDSGEAGGAMPRRLERYALAVGDEPFELNEIDDGHRALSSFSGASAQTGQ